MTARHQIRVGRRLGRDRTAIDAAPAPTVGDLLQAARERKGVDLYRAERDTKIRARHLAALESGDYAELPGAVYTKGFLRNYALYLGLDPDDLLIKWREEQELARAQEALVVAPPPTPIAEPRRGLTFTPGIIVAALLTVIVLAFLGYVGMQVVRFSQATAVALDGSPARTLSRDATSVTFSGSSAPAATINVIGPAGEILRTTHADGAGRWTVDVPVTRGENHFTLIARDPASGKDSPPIDLIVTVPLPSTPTPPPLPTAEPGSTSPPVDPGATSGNPAATAGAASPGDQQPGGQTASLRLRAPADGARFNGVVPIEGQSNAFAVRVTAVYQGRVGQPIASEPPAGGPREPEPMRIRVDDGVFSGQLGLAPGRWTVTTEALGNDAVASTSLTRVVDVSYNGLLVTIDVRGGNAWLAIWADDEPVEEGETYRRGDTKHVLARRNVVITTGNVQATFVTVNGESYGALGRSVDVGTFVIEKGEEPRRLR
jgi:hypothetical protein